ncbi:xylose isomerase domain-containing protein [Rhodococcus opacus M213]|uniref:Xylose isomerase domain-containing protein n=1 Tax=Rhodococcus opacus M213 TaxID=1129896 RepID=K8X5I8_RHOOP|nr:sugar phosphate isomerase/epimerase [Rhodococcus opacus]EKT76814.1 xylose isomerase domain-containing protein [Rhodococcus opacus M213]
MTYSPKNFALNPLQWVASADGWIDPSLAPDLETRLRTIAAAGFTSIQSDVPADMSAADFGRALAAHGIAPGPGYIPVKIAEDLANEATATAAAHERARTVAAQHAELGIPVVFVAMGMAKDAVRVAHPAIGYNPDETRLERVRDLLASTAEVVTGFGIRPAFHPHVGTWAETEEETRFVLDTVDSSVLGFGPDIGHLSWAGADTRKLIADYADRVAGVHVKDYRKDIAERGRTEGWTYQQTVLAGLWVEPGHGTDDIDDILSVLPDDWNGTVLIEVDRGAQATPEESIALCGKWIAAKSNAHSAR